MSFSMGSLNIMPSGMLCNFKGRMATYDSHQILKEVSDPTILHVGKNH